ncbi:hypothetical protein R6Q59_002857 [Mikania micrantha]
MKHYLLSMGKREPKVRILKSEAIHNPDAPIVASFSARGPSGFISDIIKWDD